MLGYKWRAPLQGSSLIGSKHEIEKCIKKLSHDIIDSNRVFVNYLCTHCPLIPISFICDLWTSDSKKVYFFGIAAIITFKGQKRKLLIGIFHFSSFDPSKMEKIIQQKEIESKNNESKDNEGNTSNINISTQSSISSDEGNKNKSNTQIKKKEDKFLQSKEYSYIDMDGTKQKILLHQTTAVSLKKWVDVIQQEIGYSFFCGKLDSTLSNWFVTDRGKFNTY